MRVRCSGRNILGGLCRLCVGKTKKVNNTVSNLFRPPSSFKRIFREDMELLMRLQCGSKRGVTKCRANNAIIGGEGNGGIIYQKVHYEGIP